MIEDAGGKALDELSTKIRPNNRYKTDRKDLDDGSMQLLATKLNNILTDPKNINQICMGTSPNIWIWGNIGAIFINTRFRTYFSTRIWHPR